jgi:quinol monooxygenase YgiN
MRTAVVGHVTIDPTRMDEAEQLLNEMVVPMVKEAQGFVSGIWTHSDDGKGVGVVTFENEQDAAAFAAQMQSTEMPPGGPVTADSFAVYQIAATA